MMRSFLYVPASSPRFLAKAHERGADAIILDLEDSVVPEEKERARAGLSEAIPAVSRGGAAVFVRINSSGGLAEGDAEAACRAGAFGLFVPKVSQPGELVKLATQLDQVENLIGRREKTALVPMVEDPGAVLDARAIATATPRVLGLVAGAEDLATSMGAEPAPEVVRLPILMVHLAAKAAGVLSFGLLRSVADYRDLDGIARDAREARRFGFDGATCIHPQVVPILNEAFSSTAEEISRAARLVAAYDASVAVGAGACVFEGKMIDAPVITRARALLAGLAGRKDSSRAV
jgi:citrate lyase subunit beta / citryl-CoA lyase